LYQNNHYFHSNRKHYNFKFLRFESFNNYHFLFEYKFLFLVTKRCIFANRKLQNDKWRLHWYCHYL